MMRQKFVMLGLVLAAALALMWRMFAAPEREAALPSAMGDSGGAPFDQGRAARGATDQIDGGAASPVVKRQDVATAHRSVVQAEQRARGQTETQTEKSVVAE